MSGLQGVLREIPNPPEVELPAHQLEVIAAVEAEDVGLLNRIHVEGGNEVDLDAHLEGAPTSALELEGRPLHDNPGGDEGWVKDELDLLDELHRGNGRHRLHLLRVPLRLCLWLVLQVLQVLLLLLLLVAAFLGDWLRRGRLVFVDFPDVNRPKVGVSSTRLHTDNNNKYEIQGQRKPLKRSNGATDIDAGMFIANPNPFDELVF